MDFSGGFVRVQNTYHSRGVDGEARPDDICPGGMQHPAHVHPWLLLEGPQQQPCKFEYDSVMLLLAAEISMGSTSAVHVLLEYLTMNLFLHEKTAESHWHRGVKP